jgi:alcohol dehydrogenase
MKAWKIERLGGKLSFVDAPIPEVRPGSVLIRVEAQSLMSYLKPYVEGQLKAYRAPEDFVPGGMGNPEQREQHSGVNANTIPI